MDIYEIYLEVGLSNSSEFDEKIIGGFVCIYIPAQNLEISIIEMKKRLFIDKYDLIDIEYVQRIDLSEWDQHRKDDYPSITDLTNALASSNHLYSSFHTYENKYEH